MRTINFYIFDPSIIKSQYFYIQLLFISPLILASNHSNHLIHIKLWNKIKTKSNCNPNQFNQPNNSHGKKYEISLQIMSSRLAKQKMLSPSLRNGFGSNMSKSSNSMKRD